MVPKIPEGHTVLVVDDEPDVHAVTRLCLKTLKTRGQRIRLLSANTGQDAVALARAHPEIAVILLDVVMETDHAGLDACRAIRAFNPFVRILLRTGQPGQAPEKQTIEDYDIDGYLPKAELTSNRLFTVVRTAIRAWEQLALLERHREALKQVSESVARLRTFEPLEQGLERTLAAALHICPARLGVLRLETFAHQGEARCLQVLLGSDATGSESEADVEKPGEEVAQAIAREVVEAGGLTALRSGRFHGGFIVPLHLHRELGGGWIFLVDCEVDEVAEQALPVLATQAANLLYATVAQDLLGADAPIFEQMSI